jgi:hypothetical protein
LEDEGRPDPGERQSFLGAVDDAFGGSLVNAVAGGGYAGGRPALVDCPAVTGCVRADRGLVQQMWHVGGYGGVDDRGGAVLVGTAHGLAVVRGLDQPRQVDDRVRAGEHQL